MNSQAEEQLKALVALGEEQLVAGQLSAISKRVKKRPKVLFFGRNTFADNTKYLYLKAVAEKREYEVEWCTTDGELAASLKNAGLQRRQRHLAPRARRLCERRPLHLVGRVEVHELAAYPARAVVVHTHQTRVREP